MACLVNCDAHTMYMLEIYIGCLVDERKNKIKFEKKPVTFIFKKYLFYLPKAQSCLL